MATTGRVLFLFLALATAASCAGQTAVIKDGDGAVAESAAKPQHPPISAADRAKAYNSFMLGMLDERKGFYSEAIKHFEEAAEKDGSLVQARLHAATLNLRLGNIDKAQTAASRGLAIDPENVRILNLLGGIYTARGQHEKALALFKRITELDPDAQHPWLNLAITHIKMGQSKEALAILKQYTDKHAEDPTGRYFLGRAYMETGNYRSARKVFEKLLVSRPDFLSVYHNLAWVQRMLGENEKALETYNKYLAINPTDTGVQALYDQTYDQNESGASPGDLRETLLAQKPEAMDYNFSLGVLFWRHAEMTGDLNQFTKALDQFQLVKANDPSNKQVVYYIANIFERIGLVNEAIETWKRISSEGGGETRDIHLKIAELYERSGKPAKSLTHALTALELDKDNPELYYFVGLLQNKLAEFEKAEEAFGKAIELEPENEKYYFYLGVIYEKMKMYSKSIEAMKKALEIKQNHPNALNYLGYLYAEQSVNLDKAEKYLKEALKLEPENGYFIDSLGWIYYKQGRYEEALNEIQTAVRNIPPDPTVLEHLGDVYDALDMPHDAIDAYERSLQAEPEEGREFDREAIRRKLSEVKKKTRKGVGK